LQIFHRRLSLLFDKSRKLRNFAGNTPAVAEEVPESNSIECALVRENELDMRFEALLLGPDLDTLHGIFVESIEQASMAIAEVLIVSMPQLV
jgi:hypothetical protein